MNMTREDMDKAVNEHFGGAARRSRSTFAKRRIGEGVGRARYPLRLAPVMGS